ncbi:MAG: exopolyphosphatase [Thermodesulfobacteriota bacterium]
MTIAAAVDLGTNSFRLLVARVEDGRIAPLAKELASVRLGQGLAGSGELAAEAMARGLAALRGFAAIMTRYQPERLRACGTHALRVAGNRDAFLQEAANILGAPVEVVEPAEEAGLSLGGAQHFLGQKVSVLLADVGGGSSELVWRDDRGTVQSVSIPVGAVSLTERYLPDPGPASPEALAALRQGIAGPLAGLALPPLPLVGSGGTATACAALDLELAAYDAALVQGYRLPHPRLAALIRRLAGLDRSARCRLPGLDQGRGEIVLAGALIYEQLLLRTGQELLTVSDAGLLEGILLSCRAPAATGH